MAIGIETKIMEGLCQRLSTLVFSPTLPVAYPNNPHSPVDGQPFLRATWLPGEPFQSSLGDAGYNRYVGLFQIDVFWPADQGLVRPAEVAAATAAHFKRGTVIDREGLEIRVIQPPYVGRTQEEPSWIMIPVRVSYQVDAQNP